MSKTVRLTTCNTSFEAHVLQSKLEAAGIASVLHNENMTNLYGGLIAAFTGVDVLVFEEELEAALAVMNDTERADETCTKPE